MGLYLVSMRASLQRRESLSQMNSFLFGCDYEVKAGACKGVFPYMPYKTTLNGTTSSSSCCFECFSQHHYRVPEVTPTSTEPITRRGSLLVSCEAALEESKAGLSEAGIQ